MGPDVFAGLHPQPVWTHFAELTRIPRASGHEAAVLAYVHTWANDRGLEAISDAAGNLRVRVPSSRGRETTPGVILQAHVDMVCTRDHDAATDPMTGPIAVTRSAQHANGLCADPNGEWIHAAGTSLGADNGVGVAMVLAAATDAGIAHGPLDLLFTVEEEVGLIGASKLDPSVVTGTMLLNLDSEEDDVFTIGCAGGRHIEVRWPIAPPTVTGDDTARAVTITGLRGGHSGVEINAGRLNAIVGLADALSQAGRMVRLRIAAIDGGDRSNAIARDARAVVTLPSADVLAFDGAVVGAVARLAARHAGSDAVPQLCIQPAPLPTRAYSVDDSATLLDLLQCLPHGVLAMSGRMPDVVESSSNVGVVRTGDGGVTMTCHVRSFVPEALEAITGRIGAIAASAGAHACAAPGYQPWNPDPESPLLKRAVAVYRRLYGDSPGVTAVHAGLECGVLKAKLPRVDALSFGPDIQGAHSTGERVRVPSVGKCYELLGALLTELAS